MRDPTPVGHLELDAVVNGNPVRMLVDTGAGVTVIDKAAAQRWGIAAEQTEQRAWAGCVGDIGAINNATVEALKLADLELTDVDVWKSSARPLTPSRPVGNSLRCLWNRNFFATSFRWHSRPSRGARPGRGARLRESRGHRH